MIRPAAEHYFPNRTFLKKQIQQNQLHEKCGSYIRQKCEKINVCQTAASATTPVSCFDGVFVFTLSQASLIPSTWASTCHIIWHFSPFISKILQNVSFTVFMGERLKVNESSVKAGLPLSLVFKVQIQ